MRCRRTISASSKPAAASTGASVMPDQVACCFHTGTITAATIGGVILGGIAGNAIARDSCRNERADAYYYNRAYYDGFENPEYGRSYEWRNPYNGHYGYMTPTRDYDDGDRSDCREFTQTIYIDGRRTQGYGTACRNSDGTWHIANDD